MTGKTGVVVEIRSHVDEGWSKFEVLTDVAPEVGYSHPVALTCVFTKRIGISPTQWQLKSNAP